MIGNVRDIEFLDHKSQQKEVEWPVRVRKKRGEWQRERERLLDCMKQIKRERKNQARERKEMKKRAAQGKESNTKTKNSETNFMMVLVALSESLPNVL